MRELRLSTFGRRNCLLQSVMHKIQYCCFIYFGFFFHLLYGNKCRYTYCLPYNHRLNNENPVQSVKFFKRFFLVPNWSETYGIILKRVNLKANFFCSCERCEMQIIFASFCFIWVQWKKTHRRLYRMNKYKLIFNNMCVNFHILWPPKQHENSYEISSDKIHTLHLHIIHYDWFMA